MQDRFIAAAGVVERRVEAAPAEAASPAYKAGLRTGDEVVGIGGKTIRGFTDIQSAVIFSEGRELDFTVKRAGETLAFRVRPEVRDGSGEDLTRT